MKKLTQYPVLAIIVLCIAALQSCTKLAKDLQYDIPLQSGSVNIVIPPMADTTVSITGTGSNSINIDSVIKAHTAGLLGIANLTSVKLTAVTMTLQNATLSNNFANFQSYDVSFSTNTNATPYQISVTNQPDVYAASMNMPVDSTAELKGYINGNDFTYSTGGKLRRATTDSLNCTVTFQFNIHVQG